MPITLKEKKIRDQFINNLQIGIGGPETSHLENPYSGQNKEGTAAGKYQFTKYWLDRAGNKSIKSFAKKNKDVFNIPNSMEDFKNDPILQDAYFRYYAEEVLYKQAKKAYSGPNPKQLSLSEIGALFHFKPPLDDKYGNTGVFKQVETGVFDKRTEKGKDGASYTNMGSLEYLKSFNEHVETNGGIKIPKKDLIETKIDTKQTKEQIINKYEDANEAINKNEYLTQGQKEVKRRALFQGIANAGDTDIINNHISKVNSENQLEYNEKIIDYNELKDVIENLDINYLDANEEKGRKSKEFKEKAWFRPFNKKDNEKIERLRDKYDFMLIKDSKNKSTNSYINHLDVKKLFKTFENKHKDLTGEDFEINPELLNSQSYKNLFNIGQGDNRVGQIEFKDLTSVKSFAPRISIDKTKIKPIPRKEEIQEVIDTQKKEEKKEVIIPKEKKEEITDPNSGAANQYFKNALRLDSLNNDEFNYEPGKKELPIDAIVGMSLGIIGDEQAKKANIPLRTEDVSLAMRNYTAELAEKSKEGLPVEIEAQMKGLLAEAYQGGLANIVNASGGNRATVLGNLGQLEQAKTKGLIGIQIADYEAKDRAFAQYGKAIEYINDFDTRRDIANHGILYQEGKEKQREGKQLATAGFSKMIDGLKYAKENGPGSANDMYRSLLMQKMFGFDPKAKDDNSGTQIGTKSWYDTKKQKTKDKFKVTKGLHETFQTLNPNQQSVVDQIIGKTQDPNTLSKVMEYVQKDGIDPAKININKINQAIQSDDMGLLSKADPTKQTALKGELASTLPITTPNKEANIVQPTGLIGNITTPQLTNREIPDNPFNLKFADNDVERPQPQFANIEEEELNGLLNYKTTPYLK